MPSPEGKVAERKRSRMRNAGEKLQSEYSESISYIIQENTA